MLLSLIEVVWLDSLTDSMDMDLSKLPEVVEDWSLVCYSPWGHKELYTTLQLNLTKWIWGMEIEMFKKKTQNYLVDLWDSIIGSNIHTIKDLEEK